MATEPRVVSKAILGIVLGVFALGLTDGFQSATSAHAQQSSPTFSFRLIGEPETLDWNRAHTPVETYLLMNLMEGLVAFESNAGSAMKVVPALAEKWTISRDGRVYRFSLRKGVKWSDGVALRAQDFVASWKRLLDPKTGASYAYFLFDVEGAEGFNRGALTDFSQVGVKAINDSTLEVRLARPIAHWIQIPTFWVTFPVREDLIAKHGTAWTQPGKLVTLGPYLLKARQTDVSVTLERNPAYYAKTGNIEKAVGLVVREDSTALNLYESGRLDFMTDISALDLIRLEGSPDGKTKANGDLKRFPYLKTGYIGFVVDQPPTRELKLRRAIGMAIDKSKFGALLHGGQEPARSWVPPGMLAHSREVGLSYDPERARKELGSVTGVTLNLTLPNTEKALTIGQYVQAELKRNLGVDVVLQPFDNKTFRSHVDLRSYPSFLLSWSADYPDPDNFLSMWITRSGNNRTNWGDSEFDTLIEKGRGMTPLTPKAVTERERIYLQAQRILLEKSAVIVPLYYEPNLALVKLRVQGLTLNPLNYLYLKQVNLGS